MALGLIYEHWRLDTNECFYVGKAHGKDPYKRANSMSYRNKDQFAIANELFPLGLIEVRYGEFSNITKEALNNLEILMIAHWKMYIGKRLTNICKGGEGGPSLPGDSNPMNLPGVREKQKNNVRRGDKHYTRQFDFVHHAKSPDFTHWIDKKSNEEIQIFIDKSMSAAKLWRETASEEELKASLDSQSEGVANWWAEMPSEKRITIGNKISQGLSRIPADVRSKQLSDGQMKRPPEERSASARVGQLNRPPEERKASARKAIEKQTPEQLSDRARKGHETRRRNKELRLAAEQAARDTEQ